ncbi:hypothetical protein OAT18_01495 [Tenacibaculum sp.]|nr:hypothetical protein [Tenacibaculum sp.]
MKLTNKEIEYGFWNKHSRKPNNLNSNNSKIYSEKNLGLSISEPNKIKDIKNWNSILPELHNVEYLWVSHKVNQETFDIICEMTSLKGLNIKWSGIEKLDKINNLTKLENLNIGNSTKITDISPLSKLLNLKTLEIENFKSVGDFSTLSKMTNLIGLGLNGGVYSDLKLNNLKPIEYLTNLKYLQLISTKIMDKSIEPLFNLKKLKSLRLTNKWSDSDFELLRQNIPNLKYGNVVPDTKAKKLIKVFHKN